MATENNVGAAPGTLGAVVRNCFAVDVGIVDTDNMTTHWKEVARYDDRETAERVAQLNRCEIRIREVAGWWNCQKHGQTPAKCRCGAATAFVPNMKEQAQ